MDHDDAQPSEGYASIGGASLFHRVIGAGRAVFVLHGGPDFDHAYLLPELDGVADTVRLIYYDQRGRGRSGDGVAPADVSIASEVADLEDLRRHFGIESAVLLGHSWGTVLALEYAIRHPGRVSHLILMNPAPASADDLLLLRKALANRRTAADRATIAEVLASEEYGAGDLETDSRFYRAHFRATVRDEGNLERIVRRLRVNVTSEGILKARAIEARLMQETWLVGDYDLLPKLAPLDIPTLILWGEHDFIPIEIARNIEQAMRGARLVVLPECGHFAYLERPDDVRREIAGFLEG